MNRKSLLMLVALVALLVTAYSHTPPPTPEQKTQTPSRQPDAPTDGSLQRIAATANAALKNYPTTAQVKELDDPQARRLLERGRKLLEAGQAAAGWNTARLNHQADQVEQFVKEAKAFQATKSTTGFCVPGCDGQKTQCQKLCNGSVGCVIQCGYKWIECFSRCWIPAKFVRG
jgi:hypothetical protein